jgi:hypothetical protein
MKKIQLAGAVAKNSTIHLNGSRTTDNGHGVEMTDFGVTYARRLRDFSWKFSGKFRKAICL